MCFKGVCDQAPRAPALAVGLTLGIMLGTDEVLKSANREPIFAPLIASILNIKKPMPLDLVKESHAMINNNLNKMALNNDELRMNESLIERFKKLNLKGDISSP